MSKAVITESSLSDIGDAIREKLGVSTEYLPSQMGAAVRSISGDYSDLSNKPQINSVELSGNKSSSDLGLQDALSFDATPTSGSTNPVTSGGVYTALADLLVVETFDFYTQKGSLMGVPAGGDSASYINVAKTGYTPIFATLESTGSAFCYAYRCELSGAAFSISVHNVGTDRVEVSPHVRVLYRKA